jgi:3-deoxy-7-phosphoheptulonate synthase
MIIITRYDITDEELDHIRERVEAAGLHTHLSRGERRTIIGCIGDEAKLQEVPLRSLPGVEQVLPVLKPYKLASKEFAANNTIVRVGANASIGSDVLTVIAGPCSVENRTMLHETAHAVQTAGATILRGGAFKPRTSPYSFQGLGVEGLRYLAEARDRTGMPVITEVMEPSQVDIVAEYSDILQIGTRNMQNFSLLLACGRSSRPVMLKRGFGATIEEWLMAAEYIASAGNAQIILCERGIRTFETSTRNTLDLTAVPLMHHLTHLPIVVDPSHATGKRWLVKPLAIGGVAVGADGIMVEVHPNPDDALSDAEQQLDFGQFEVMMEAVTAVHEHVRDLHGDLLRTEGVAAGVAGSANGAA